jgi:hypothetical protein
MSLGTVLLIILILLLLPTVSAKQTRGVIRSGCKALTQREEDKCFDKDMTECILVPDGDNPVHDNLYAFIESQ